MNLQLFYTVVFTFQPVQMKNTGIGIGCICWMTSGVCGATVSTCYCQQQIILKTILNILHSLVANVTLHNSV